MRKDYPTPNGYDRKPMDPAAGPGTGPGGKPFTSRQLDFFAFNQERIDAARARDTANAEPAIVPKGGKRKFPFILNFLPS